MNLQDMCHHHFDTTIQYCPVSIHQRMKSCSERLKLQGLQITVSSFSYLFSSFLLIFIKTP
nr:MAG TPA: hypothetical protein [Bacteriophage sp.]